MSDELKLLINDDGEAEVYDDTYDITIHCTSEEEKNEVIEHLNSMRWIPVTERLPGSSVDDLEYPTVIICCDDGTVTLACYYESTKEWGRGENFDSKCFPSAWMPLPSPYEAESEVRE